MFELHMNVLASISLCDNLEVVAHVWYSFKGLLKLPLPPEWRLRAALESSAQEES